MKYILAPTVQGWFGLLVPGIRRGKTIISLYLKSCYKEEFILKSLLYTDGGGAVGANSPGEQETESFSCLALVVTCFKI